MTATKDPSANIATRATPEERRATAIGIVLVLLGAFVLWIFALGVEEGARSTFNLSLPGARIENLTWEVNARWLAYIVAAVIAFLGGMVLRRSHLKRTNLMLAVGMGLFALAFLTWAAAGQSFSLVGMLRSTVVLSVPVTLGALSGLMCERVAIINIAIEGQLLSAAFVGVIMGSAWGIWGRAHWSDSHGSGAWLGARSAVDTVPHRPDNRRRCDQHLRAWA